MAELKQIAAYILNKANSDDAGDLISNLKLQKLVYYAQGFHLVIFGSVLFQEPIDAWQHGPVVEDLYHEFKQFGRNAIPTPEYFDAEKLTTDQKELLDEVYEVYGQFSAWKLRNMTHQEAPWKEADETGSFISDKSMTEYFKTQLQ